MKIAPLLRVLEAEAEKFKTTLIHTGQHYDYKMSQVFFDQLGIREPDVFLDVGSGTHSKQTAEVLIKLEDRAFRELVDLVVVVGDVNSTLAASLAASKLNIPVAHVEAGLRSYDRAMPEEINRVLTDHIASVLLVSEPSGVANLKREGISGEAVHLVGNTMIDSLSYCLKYMDAAELERRVEVEDGEYAVVTIHRPSNVDNPESLRTVLKILQDAAARMRLVFPIHPRTAKRIKGFDLCTSLNAIPGLTVTEPMGYFDFVSLVRNAACVITDSGGIQEETTWLGVPCITLRENTERPLTVEEGTNEIVGLNLEKTRRALDRAQRFEATGYKAPAIWDGHAAGRIISIFEDFLSVTS